MKRSCIGLPSPSEKDEDDQTSSKIIKRNQQSCDSEHLKTAKSKVQQKITFFTKVGQSSSIGNSEINVSESANLLPSLVGEPAGLVDPEWQNLKSTAGKPSVTAVCDWSDPIVNTTLSVSSTNLADAVAYQDVEAGNALKVNSKWRWNCVLRPTPSGR
jgi:hypothetical protein